ncbi:MULTISPECIES: hypothetical protein [unclassified Mesorhizobium]|uniref:hypothetical protein n=1 Tax=unclassified Mesorhizobium TaxID=325217 RepID=UPI00112EC239|nr:MULTISPECIES: hypothetical protein [unclassified Mesorhizobium]TPL05581.1 hypothetical protein FJ567_00430 [Mesorhizobium sp. B2-4-16]TPL75349.1 hypothetical protein FJ956_05915 [Mesorhizobium sp. B2-4-3]
MLISGQAAASGEAQTNRKSGSSEPVAAVQQWTGAVLLAVAAIGVAGLVLRLLGARGDLWMDEIWSLVLLEPLTSIDQIFWRINHDNNHFLNSIYLYLIGPDASPLLQRGLSIALGAGAVVAAGAAARGRWAAVATSLLFAISYPMVHYGSEARGYAGLVLFTLLAVVFLERWLDKRGSGVAFGAIVLLGFLSHLIMVETVAVLVAWTAWLIWRRTGSFDRINVELGQIFAPAFLAVLPIAACMLIGRLLFGFRIGGALPFSLQAFAQGYGGMIRYLFGVPDWIGDWVCIATACGLVCVCAAIWRDRRASLYVIGIVGLPIVMAAARLPNAEFQRYFLVPATFMLLWAGELLGRGFAAGGKYRVLAAAAMVAILAGTTTLLLPFYEYGRGSYATMVDKMTRDGPADYATNQEFRTVMIVDYFAKRLGRQASFVAEDKICDERPSWLILEGAIDRQPQYVDAVPDCMSTYERVDASTSWGLSGLGWTLYQRRD